ncbi:MAG TPA: DUF4192 domain-containing protein, partial [Trebonia sp.]|nr:DUF4192 domain-containing protein [Trebonia sp.]
MTANRSTGDQDPQAPTAKRVDAANRAREARVPQFPAQDDAPAGGAPPGAPGPWPPEQVVQVGSPASLLALIPQLLGFEPRMSIVFLGAQAPSGRVRLTLRFDLPGEPDRGIADELARHALGVLAAQGFGAGVAVGYGPGRLVSPLVDAVRRRAAELGFQLSEVLRAEDNRYWSYLCTEPACCRPDGESYDVPGHPVTAAFTAAGAAPVLASREALTGSIAMLAGPAGEAMAAATRQAEA